MRKFMYGIGVGITLAYTVVFALSYNSASGIEATDSKIIVGQ